MAKDNPSVNPIRAKFLSLLEEGGTLDLRADGKAGSGLVMTLQTFAESVSMKAVYQVQEWPLFSSARKGANLRGFLRIGRGTIFLTCQIERPHLALLMNEKTGEEIDFASGVSKGLFIINSEKSPEEMARKFRLRGEIITVPGDRLGREYLKSPIPNISVLAALQKVLPLVSVQEILESLEHIGKKRRLPQKAVLANQNCLSASLEEVKSAVILEGEEDHPLPIFQGYKDYPTGAQSHLRTSLTNKTANYARAGRRLVFRDPQSACTGCSLCIVNCPEGIVMHVPDEKRGVKVLGADTNQFCKLCRECIEVCPIDLFQEVSQEELEKGSL